jgi:hypothetical protein
LPRSTFAARTCTSALCQELRGPRSILALLTGGKHAVAYLEIAELCLDTVSGQGRGRSDVNLCGFTAEGLQSNRRALDCSDLAANAVKVCARASSPAYTISSTRRSLLCHYRDTKTSRQYRD